MGLVSSWFSSQRRGLATGIAVSGSSFGLRITGLAVPAILFRYGPSGWRVAWFCLAAGALLIAIICAVFARNSPAARRSSATVKSAEPHPLRHVLSSGRIWFLAGTYVLFGFSFIIYSTFFVRFLTAEVGFTTRTAGASGSSSDWSASPAAELLSVEVTSLRRCAEGPAHPPFPWRSGNAAVAPPAGFRFPARP